jgi:hypothetical protein
VDGLSSARRRDKCRVTILDAETSSVIATRSFDSGFVRQASIRQLLNIMSVEYRYRSHRVEQFETAFFHHDMFERATRSVALLHRRWRPPNRSTLPVAAGVLRRR